MRKVKSMKERREKSRSEFPWRKYTFFQERKGSNGMQGGKVRKFVVM